MRYLLTLALFAFAGLAPAGEFTVTPAFRVSAGEPRGAVEAADPSASTCVVSHPTGPGVWDSGTGTVVACEGGRSLVLTNAHVVPLGSRDITVAHGGKTHPATLVASCQVVQVDARTIDIRGVDLALVSVDANLPAARIADEPPRIGDRLRQWGFGGRTAAQGPTFKAGKVLDPNRLAGSFYSQSGDSGSGVFNDAGELVAVTHGNQLPQSPVLALPLAKVREFVKKWCGKLFPRLAERLAGKKDAKDAKDAPKEDEPTPPKFEVKPMPKPEPPKSAAPAPPRYEFLGYDRYGRPVFRECVGNR